MFLNKLHIYTISLQSVENCDFVMLMLERKISDRYYTDRTFPWYGLTCVYSSYFYLSKSIHTCYIGMVFLVCGYAHVFARCLIGQMFLYTLHNYKASHHCGLADVFLSHLLERMSFHKLCTDVVYHLCAQRYAFLDDLILKMLSDKFGTDKAFHQSELECVFSNFLLK